MAGNISVEISGGITVVEDGSDVSVEVTSSSGLIDEIAAQGPAGATGAQGPAGTDGADGADGSDASILIVPRTEMNDQNYTLQSTDYLIAITALSEARTITIPFSLISSGRMFRFVDESRSAGTYNVTILPEAGHGTLINGQASIKLELNGDAFTIYAGNNAWHVSA
jgi:hypothetical protein